MTDLKERLLSRFTPDPKAGCWEWTAAKSKGGYGQIRSRHGLHYAHRTSFELHFGPIPAGMFVCHRCDNRACINPEHLFVGTNAENVADKVAKGRQPRGSNQSGAKLNEADVLAIRAASGVRQRDLAARYNVDQGLISQIRAGKKWAHLSLKKEAK